MESNPAPIGKIMAITRHTLDTTTSGIQAFGKGSITIGRTIVMG
jgi:hypothetical protein